MYKSIYYRALLCFCSIRFLLSSTSFLTHFSFLWKRNISQTQSDNWCTDRWNLPEHFLQSQRIKKSKKDGYPVFGILRAEVRLHKGLSILKGNSVAKLVGINFQIGLLAFLLMLVINRSNKMGCKGCRAIPFLQFFLTLFKNLFTPSSDWTFGSEFFGGLGKKCVNVSCDKVRWRPMETM